MSKYNAADIRKLKDVDTVGDAILLGSGRQRRAIGSISGNDVTLTAEGEELIKPLIPQPDKDFNELALYAQTTFGVKLDKRKNLSVLKQEIAKLEEQANQATQ